MKKCPKCNTEYADIAQFCSHCGAKLDEIASAQPQVITTANKKNNNKMMMIAGAVALALLVGGFGYSKYQDHQEEVRQAAILAQQEKERAEQEAADKRAFEQAIELAKAGKWQECVAKTDEIVNKQNDVPFIVAWAKAQVAFGKSDFDASAKELAIVPENYQGQFSKEILSMKNTIVPQKIAEKKAAEERAAKRREMEANGYVWVSDADGQDNYAKGAGRNNPWGTSFTVTVTKADGTKEHYLFQGGGEYYSINGSGMVNDGSDGKNGRVADNKLAYDICEYARPIIKQQVEEYQRKNPNR